MLLTAGERSIRRLLPDFEATSDGGATNEAIEGAHFELLCWGTNGFTSL
jgi:hypothetical protein